MAVAAGVPPFVIFGDQSLAEMAAFLPSNQEEMLAINGVGEHKLKRYGEDFLAVINDFMKQADE
jgi:ATP-dependent DNA helicase RecQ